MAEFTERPGCEASGAPAPAPVNQSTNLSDRDNGLYTFKLKGLLLRRVARWYDHLKCLEDG
jgi:hypothetical protein